jgi:hypothetical protein
MSAAPIDKLVLVFKADAGLWSAFLDSARKALAMPACSLCALTHGLAGERPEWRAAKAALGVPVEYVHRDELSGAVRDAASVGLPCVLAESEGRVEPLVTPAEIDGCGGDYPTFERLLSGRVAARRSGLS